MKKIYFCYTIYHFIIAYIDSSNNDDIVFFDKIPNVENLKIILEKYKAFNEIFLNNEKDYCFDHLDFKKYDKIIIFNDSTRLSKYIQKKRIKYTLYEDGFNFFCLKIYDNNFLSYLKFIFRKYVVKKYIPFGYSKYCISINVNDKKCFKEKDSRYKKVIEQNRNEMFSNISLAKFELLKKIYSIPNLMINDKNILLLTQPLYSDSFDKKVIKTEIDQLKFYSNIINKYMEEYTIYIKVHPRDNVDYSHLLNERVLLLDRETPIEIYEFFINGCFDLGITHSSTALYYLSCVKEKIFLKDLRK